MAVIPAGYVRGTFTSRSKADEARHAGAVPLGAACAVSSSAGYIHCYNHDRIKLKLDGMSPVGYRAQYNSA